MSFRKIHGFSLAANSWAENFHVERLSNDPAVLEAGRVWYNTTQKRYKMSMRDTDNNLIIRHFVDNKDLQDYFQGLDWRQEVRAVLSEPFGTNSTATFYGKDDDNGAFTVSYKTPGSVGDNYYVDIRSGSGVLEIYHEDDSRIDINIPLTDAVYATYNYTGPNPESNILFSTGTYFEGDDYGNYTNVEMVNEGQDVTTAEYADYDRLKVSLRGNVLSPASYDLISDGHFNDVKFEAVTPGPDGNNYTITINDQADNQPYSASVTGTDIIVNIPTQQNTLATVTMNNITLTEKIANSGFENFRILCYPDQSFTAKIHYTSDQNHSYINVDVWLETDGSSNPVLKTELEIYNLLISIPEITEKLDITLTGDGSATVTVAPNDLISSPFSTATVKYPTANELINLINADTNINSNIIAKPVVSNEWIDVTDIVKAGNFYRGSVNGTTGYIDTETDGFGDRIESYSHTLTGLYVTKVRFTYPDGSSYTNDGIDLTEQQFTSFVTPSGMWSSWSIDRDWNLGDTPTETLSWLKYVDPNSPDYDTDVWHFGWDGSLGIYFKRPISIIKVEVMCELQDGMERITNTNLPTSESFTGGTNPAIFATALEVMQAVNNASDFDSTYYTALVDFYSEGAVTTAMGTEWWDHGNSVYDSVAETYTSYTDSPGNDVLSLDIGQLMETPVENEQSIRFRFNYTGGPINYIELMNNNGENMIVGGETLTSYTSGEWIEIDRETWGDRAIYFARIQSDTPFIVSGIEFKMPDTGGSGIVDELSTTPFTGGVAPTCIITAQQVVDLINLNSQYSEAELVGNGTGIIQHEYASQSLYGGEELLPTIVDGVTLELNNRILVKSFSDKTQNGIYTVSDITGQTVSITRAEDADEDHKVNQGMYCFVMEGTKYKGSGFVLTTKDPITLGTTELNFTQFSATSEINAGVGLQKDGNELSIKLDGNTLQVNEDGLSVVSSITDFLSLTDTPSTFGSSGQVLSVNLTSDGLIWKDVEIDPATILKIDTIQGSSGFNPDGTYISPTETIINSSTTLADADSKLATAITTLTTSINSKVFTFTSDNPATTHTITHNLNSNNLEITVWVYNTSTNKYEVDTVGISQTNQNVIVVDLTESANIKAIIRDSSVVSYS